MLSDLQYLTNIVYYLSIFLYETFVKSEENQNRISGIFVPVFVGCFSSEGRGGIKSVSLEIYIKALIYCTITTQSLHNFAIKKHEYT